MSPKIGHLRRPGRGCVPHRWRQGRLDHVRSPGRALIRRRFTGREALTVAVALNHQAFEHSLIVGLQAR
jgi:hypothetical protein